MKLLSCIQPTKFLGVQHTQLITRGISGHTAQLITRGIPGRTAQLITCKIPGRTAIMQPSHALCTLYSESAQIWSDYGVTFAHILTYLPNPHALSKKAMTGKDIVSKLEYSPVKKIRESEALLVRQCSSHLGEYGLTLWVVSILMYVQELHNFFFFVSCVACLPRGPSTSTICQLIFVHLYA